MKWAILMIRFGKKKVVFVFSPQYRYGGGTVMRGEQLSQIIASSKFNDYRVLFEPATNKFKNRLLFMTKMAVTTASIEDLNVLAKNNNILLFDANDGRIDDEKIKHADAIIVSSKTGLVNYRDRYPGKKVVLIDHHVDPRIYPNSTRDDSAPSIGYFGEPANAIITENISKLVDIIPVDTSSQDNMRWLDKIANYSIHYAVRKRQNFDDYRPATKIFTAAYCGANVIVQESEEEAIGWLGGDYPYIIKGNPTEQSIIEMLVKATDSFGGDEWGRGLDIMRNIRSTMTNDRIIEQFRGLLKDLDY